MQNIIKVSIFEPEYKDSETKNFAKTEIEKFLNNCIKQNLTLREIRQILRDCSSNISSLKVC